MVFQPHTYSRTKNLLEDFAKVLINFDNIIITDIYAAREENIYNISSHDLVDRIVTLGKKAVFISDFNEIANYLKSHIQPNDIVLTLGAGPIDKVFENFNNINLFQTNNLKLIRLKIYF